MNIEANVKMGAVLSGKTNTVAAALFIRGYVSALSSL